MKPSRGPLLIDQVAPLLLKEPRAGPYLEPNEIIACTLNSIPYAFWRQPLSEDSIVVHTILDALKRSGWKIVPL
jgi:hypothetical protein